MDLVAKVKKKSGVITNDITQTILYESECFSYTFQGQVCTQNGFSSLYTLRPKNAGPDTRVWMTLHPPLPHLQPRSFLHNTQTTFLRPPFEVETSSTFPVGPANFWALNQAGPLRLQGGGGDSSHVPCCKKALLDHRTRSWVRFQPGSG